MSPSFTPASVRRQAYLVAYAGITQLLVFLGTAAYDFWWGTRTLLLQVRAYKIATGRPPLSQFIDSPVGAYSTGTQGDLLYRTESLGDHLLFYRLGDLTIVDAFFTFATGLYLCWILLGVRAGQEFSTRLSKAFTIVGISAVAMYTIKLAFELGITRLFEARTQSLFYLTSRSDSHLYVYMGILLLACAHFLRRGEELQQQTDLTI